MSLKDPRINHSLITTTYWTDNRHARLVQRKHSWQMCHSNPLIKSVAGYSYTATDVRLPIAHLTGPAHPAGEITVKINYPEHHTINSTDSSYGLGKPENRVAVPVGAEIFLLTTAFRPVHPACCPVVQVSAIKRQGVIRITHFHLAPKLKHVSPMRLNGAMLN